MIMRLMFSSYILLVATVVAGCSGLGDVPSELRVDSGLEPKNIDEQVRFRTTYYFRVLEGCPLEKADSARDFTRDSPFIKRISGDFRPLSDSLYRFRMTGQAAALFNKIHFESGVLRKEQIDPFGSTVQFNEGTNSFFPISADQLRAQAKGDAAMNDIRRVRTLLEELKQDSNLSEENKQHFESQIKEIIQHRLGIIKTNPAANQTKDKTDIAKPESVVSAKTPTPSGAFSTGDAASIPTSSEPTEIDQKPRDPSQKATCNGQPSLKKYYLLGPEGSKELDPNDRLLMALSVDSKPLLGMLQQISEHKFQSHEASFQVIEDILNERGRVFDAQRQLANAKDKTISEEGPIDESSLHALADNLRSIFQTVSTTSK